MPFFILVPLTLEITNTYLLNFDSVIPSGEGHSVNFYSSQLFRLLQKKSLLRFFYRLFDSMIIQQVVLKVNAAFPVRTLYLNIPIRQ